MAARSGIGEVGWVSGGREWLPGLGLVRWECVVWIIGWGDATIADVTSSDWFLR